MLSFPIASVQVRVGGPEDRVGIQQALDLGASGIMVPTIKTVEDVKRVVDACYLPPLGSRSIAWPIRCVCACARIRA